MKINGKELKMLYCIGADDEIDEELTKYGVNDLNVYIQKRGFVKAYVKLAAILHRWACIKDGNENEAITEREIMTIDAADAYELRDEVIAAYDRGNHRTVELKDSKNAESADK